MSQKPTDPAILEEIARIKANFKEELSKLKTDQQAVIEQYTSALNKAKQS